MMGHSVLKCGRVQRTPSMQAGTFDRPVTIREIFMRGLSAGAEVGDEGGERDGEVLVG